MGVTAAVAVGAALVGHTIESSNQQRRLAGQERNRQNVALTKAEEEAKAKQKRDQEQGAQRTAMAIRRRQAAAVGGPAQTGTIGGGIEAPPVSGGKTLLGA